MDWPMIIKGFVAILAVTALGIYANESRYRRAAKFRQRRGQEAKTEQPHSIP